MSWGASTDSGFSPEATDNHTKKWTELGEKQSLWDYVGKGTLCENSAKSSMWSYLLR